MTCENHKILFDLSAGFDMIIHLILLLVLSNEVSLVFFISLTRFVKCTNQTLKVS